MSAELQRIRSDLKRAKERVAQIRAGQRGVRNPDDWRAGDDADGGNSPGHGRAYENQLRAAEQTVTRLEAEYVNAMIPNPWSPAAIIEAMEGPKHGPGATGDQASRGGSVSSTDA